MNQVKWKENCNTVLKYTHLILKLTIPYYNYSSIPKIYQPIPKPCVWGGLGTEILSVMDTQIRSSLETYYLSWAKIDLNKCEGHIKDNMIPFLAYFLYLEKIKVSLCNLHTVCVSACLWIPAPVNFECLNITLWKFICIWWHLSQFQWCTSYSPPISRRFSTCMPLRLLGNGSVKTLPRQ